MDSTSLEINNNYFGVRHYNVKIVKDIKEINKLLTENEGYKNLIELLKFNNPAIG